MGRRDGFGERLALFLSQPRVEHERPERNEPGQERQGSPHPRPLHRRARLSHGNHKKNEEQSMNPADDFRWLRVAHGVFQRHGDAEKDEEGGSFEIANEAESAQRGVRHQWVLLGCAKTWRWE